MAHLQWTHHAHLRVWALRHRWMHEPAPPMGLNSLCSMIVLTPLSNVLDRVVTYLISLIGVV